MFWIKFSSSFFHGMVVGLALAALILILFK
jgi:tetrahydromethanopterin S-methyltransferase subunit B